jgi:hypothetical protein
MSYFTFTIFKAALVLLLGSVSTSAFAAGQVDDLLAALSNAKAELEGRATRVQNCSTLQSSKMLEVLRSQFDDARNPYNGRLDSWIFVLKN